MFLLIIFVAEQGRKGYQSTTTQVSAHEVVCQNIIIINFCRAQTVSKCYVIFYNME